MRTAMMITIAWFFWTMVWLYRSRQRSSVMHLTFLYSTTERTYRMAVTFWVGGAVGLINGSTLGSWIGDCRFVNRA
jgi:hypothetical protein